LDFDASAKISRRIGGGVDALAGRQRTLGAELPLLELLQLRDQLGGEGIGGDTHGSGRLRLGLGILDEDQEWE
jgi:hypothetical protein